MKIDCSGPAGAGGGRGRQWLVAAVAFFALACTTNVSAQAPAAAGGASAIASVEELAKLVERIALYPDDLVGIILPAATSPLQIVQAERYLAKRKTDPKLPVDEKWDDPIKSLLNYPEVVTSMSSDLDWTSALGEAVVADQGAVLEAIQAFRRKTQAVGNLKSDAKQVVVIEKEVIKIVPADPQVIYVPQYNPSTVVVYGGYSYWGYYPTPYPVYYYPYAPGAAFATGLIWGAAISSAWHGGHYVAHYGVGGGNININNVNINRNTNINTGNINRSGGATQLPAGGSSQWKSNKQSGQVSGSVGQSTKARAGYSSAGGAAGGGGAAAARPSTQPLGGGANSAGSNAFSGYGGSGRQTQMDSSRGASSRSSMQGGGSRPSSASTSRSGGGARSGGGGGRRR